MAQTVNQTAKTFRDTFKISKEVIQWYPGHMKKSFHEMQSKMKSVDCVIEVHDSRIPLSGRNPNFMKRLLGIKPHLVVFNKKDLISAKMQKEVEDALHARQESNFIFTNSTDQLCRGLKKVVPRVVDMISESERFNRSEVSNYQLMVIGIPNVGKSSLINALRGRNLHRGKANAVGAIAGITKAVQNKVKVNMNPPIYLYDTPGILPPNIKTTEIGMKLALCSCLNDENVGIANIADFLLYWMNKNRLFYYVEHFKLNEPSDEILPILVKIAKDNQKFSKIKNVTNNKLETLPNVQWAAYQMVKAFRTGDLGQYVLDDLRSSDE